jgi:23S rRNA pseudouridine2605 synthase
MSDNQNTITDPIQTSDQNPKMRVAKAIARAGICSRRDAEKLVLAECVSINGKLITTPNINVYQTDKITVNGKIIPQIEPARLWLYHKPVGVICTNKDADNRRTIFDDLPPTLPRVISVGRLDLNSEGLLLLTNDGDLAKKLENPQNNYKRVYKVRVYGRINLKKLKSLENGITIDNIHYAKIIATPSQNINADNAEKTPLNIWLKVVLSEGKNREIRKIMEHLGYRVSRLIRISFGEFHLKQLKKSEVMEVSKGEVYLKAKGGKPKKSWAKAKPKPKAKINKRRNKQKNQTRQN